MEFPDLDAVSSGTYKPKKLKITRAGDLVPLRRRQRIIPPDPMRIAPFNRSSVICKDYKRRKRKRD